MSGDSLVVAAVKRDLKTMPKGMAGSGLAALALAMAAEMDDPDNSATSKSMCAGRLQEALDRLRELAPPKEETSPVDELRARRSARRKGASAS